jgi:hypothetical protein
MAGQKKESNMLLDIVEGNKALIVKNRDENKFMKWLGRGEKRSRRSVQLSIPYSTNASNNLGRSLSFFSSGSGCSDI